MGQLDSNCHTITKSASTLSEDSGRGQYREIRWSNKPQGQGCRDEEMGDVAQGVDKGCPSRPRQAAGSQDFARITRESEKRESVQCKSTHNMRKKGKQGNAGGAPGVAASQTYILCSLSYAALPPQYLNNVQIIY
jgi:hypothetical protein